MNSYHQNDSIFRGPCNRNSCSTCLLNLSWDIMYTLWRWMLGIVNQKSDKINRQWNEISFTWSLYFPIKRLLRCHSETKSINYILPNNRASKNIFMTHHTYFLGLWKTQTCNVHYWRFLLHGKMQESVKTSFGIRNHKKAFLR